VFGDGFFRDGGGDYLGSAGGGETAEADIFVMLDEGGGFFRGEDGIWTIHDWKMDAGRGFT
jgi:hypothetical protein